MATKRNQATDTEVHVAHQTLSGLIPRQPGSAAEVLSNEQSAASDLLHTCCAEFRANYERFVASTLSTLQYALAAGKYVVLMKEIVGHGNFRPFCEREFPTISFRRIEQFKWLAENRDELVILLRAENAQHDAHLSDNELLGSASIRKAQRMLARPVDEISGKRRSKKRVKFNTGSITTSVADDALTPTFVIDATLGLFGEIDLDPCANEHLPHHVPAKCCWTSDQDGLARSAHWTGRALVNPPFTSIAAWVEKAKREFQSGRLTEALLLIPAQTDSTWFLALADHPPPFLRERLTFASVDGSASIESLDPYAVIFLGPAERAGAFASAFASLADTYLPISAAPRPVQTEN